MTDDIIPIRKPTVLGEAGGSMDQISVTLAIYGDDLDPEAVTARLGCAPTHAHRRGDRKGPRSRAFEQGAWFLTEEQTAPIEADKLVSMVLGRFPTDEELWTGLHRDYRVQIRFGLHLSMWNRGFELGPATMKLLAMTGAPAMFDIYYYGDEA